MELEFQSVADAKSFERVARRNGLSVFRYKFTVVLRGSSEKALALCRRLDLEVRYGQARRGSFA